MAYKDKGGRVLKAAPITVGAGAVDLDGGKAKRPGFFVGVWRERQKFSKLGSE